MNRTRAIFISLIAAAACLGGGCDRQPAKKPPAPAPVVKTQWSAEEIAKDPVGYLQWSDQQVAAQIALTEQKIESLTDNRGEIAKKRDTLLANLDDVANIRKRLSEAYQRAEDEDRWPVRMADRTFTREKALAILAQTKKYLEDRRPLEQQYDGILKKLDDTVATLRTDITRLGELRQKIELDMTEVKINQGNADLDKLRKNEAQLRSMSGAVAALSSDNGGIVAPKEPPGRVNIEEMLK